MPPRGAQVTGLYQRAAIASPNDADVFVALGVMENINRHLAFEAGHMIYNIYIINITIYNYI